MSIEMTHFFSIRLMQAFENDPRDYLRIEFETNIDEAE